jgi:hypothetical protein
MDRVKGFLMSKALLKGDSSKTSHPLHHVRVEKVSVSVHLVCLFSFFFWGGGGGGSSIFVLFVVCFMGRNLISVVIGKACAYMSMPGINSGLLCNIIILIYPDLVAKTLVLNNLV